MNITVIGQGFVGLSLSVFLSSKNIFVNAIDTDNNKVLNLKKGIPPFFEPNLENLLKKSIKSKKIKFYTAIDDIDNFGEIFFITVPTPNINGKINLNFIFSVLESLLPKIKKLNIKPIIVIKSTISPGTTQKKILPIFRKYFKKLGSDFFLSLNPEFLREGNAISDQINPHVVVLGCEDIFSRKKLNEFFMSIYGNKIPIVNTNFTTAELIKYTNNAFLATKISFINSISNLCQKIPGSNIDEIAKVIGMDSRVGPLFLNAGPGFGGSCLPKDLESFISVFKENKINSNLFTSVKEINDDQINNILNLITDKIPNLSSKTISIYGLAFKENSDDVRSSKSLELISRLLSNKCRINVFDNLAISNTKKIFKNKIFYYSSFEKCILNSDCLILMHPLKIKNLNKKFFDKMKNPLIIDTRRSINKKFSLVNCIELGVNNNSFN